MNRKSKFLLYRTTDILLYIYEYIFDMYFYNVRRMNFKKHFSDLGGGGGGFLKTADVKCK